MMAASVASTSFMLPPLVLAASAPWSLPKPANRTFASERFMAFAMSCVSSVPAAPTTMPAIIMAGLARTKPSKPTANPVSAFSSEITTGMSAPPIGKVTSAPSAAAAPKNSNSRSPLSTPAPRMSATPTATTARPMLPICSAAERGDLRTSPCSLANAISEPVNATMPMSAPTTASASTSGARAAPPSSSIAAMAAAAPPPMPL